MGVKYAAREEPPKPGYRGRGVGTSSEDPVTKKLKKPASPTIDVSSRATGERPPRAPVAQVSTRKLEALKKKGTLLDKYLRRFSGREMGSDSFMKELAETVSYSPPRGEKVELYLDQFGSLLSCPNNIGKIIVDLH